ncbi:MAG: TlpA family protein disulfide reductase [Thermoanaerobaculia bacterium]|nr:TlpA family protein disulfide reductase [Thermoanaerobaculia bacterium]
MVDEFGGRAKFVVEDLGASAIAERFGVGAYPAIFVDQALVARPEDFYEWGGPKSGKYIPWTDLANRRRFQEDLRTMIGLRLEGGDVPSLEITKGAAPAKTLPDVAMTRLDGRRITFSQLRGKPVLVEFWATWCPMCIKSMEWMKTLDPAKVEVVNIAIESKREDVEKLVASLQPLGNVVIASDAVRQAFSGPPAVPTLVLADDRGNIVKVFYGAPDTLHDEVGRALEGLESVSVASR